MGEVPFRGGCGPLDSGGGCEGRTTLVCGYKVRGAGARCQGRGGGGGCDNGDRGELKATPSVDTISRTTCISYKSL